MIDTQLLNDVLVTLAFVVGLVIAISAWVVAAAAIHERHTRQAHIGAISAIEQHLSDVAEERSPASAA
jgi:hypothetical protein